LNLIFFSLFNGINGLVVTSDDSKGGGGFSIMSIIAFAKGPFLS
jgi:hypothetical protein